MSIIHSNDQFIRALERQVRVSALHSTTRANAVTAEQLSERWNIGLTKAKKMLNVTTQHGTRTVAYPTLNAIFRTTTDSFVTDG
jgi:hypothetical protein